MNKKTMLVSALIIVAALVAVHLFASRTLTFSEQVTIDASIEDAWEVMGNQFASPHIWAANFLTSEPGGAPKLKGVDFRHRATTTANGDNWQELDTFDPSTHSLSYHISKGVPPIAKRGTGHWKLTELAEGKTQLQVDFVLETKGLLGLVMSAKVNKSVGQASGQLIEEFKYYLEHGTPHPRKLNAAH